VQWVSAVSATSSFDEARGELESCLERELVGTPDLICLFLSPELASGYARIVRWIRDRFTRVQLFGGVVPGVIGAGREIHPGPGISLTAAVLPGCNVQPLRVPAMRPGARLELDAQLVEHAGPHWILLSDAHSIDTEALLRELDQRHPSGVRAGGMISDPLRRAPTCFFLNERVYGDGAVGISLGGNLAARVLLAEGCEPLGEPLIVMGVHENVVSRFDRGPATEVLAEILRTLDEPTRVRADRGLCLGIQAGPHDPRDERVRFVMRGLLGISQSPSGLAVAAVPKLHEIVQLHVATAEVAHAELEAQLREFMRNQKEPMAGLWFRSTGRSEAFYGTSGHETSLVQSVLGPHAIGGCFCNGEIAPLNGRSHLNGFSSAIVAFRPARGS